MAYFLLFFLGGVLLVIHQKMINRGLLLRYFRAEYRLCNFIPVNILCYLVHLGNKICYIILLLLLFWSFAFGKDKVRYMVFIPVNILGNFIHLCNKIRYVVFFRYFLCNLCRIFLGNFSSNNLLGMLLRNFIHLCNKIRYVVFFRYFLCNLCRIFLGNFSRNYLLWMLLSDFINLSNKIRNIILIRLILFYYGHRYGNFTACFLG